MESGIFFGIYEAFVAMNKGDAGLYRATSTFIHTRACELFRKSSTVCTLSPPNYSTLASLSVCELQKSTKYILSPFF